MSICIKSINELTVYPDDKLENLSLYINNENKKIYSVDKENNEINKNIEMLLETIELTKVKITENTKLILETRKYNKNNGQKCDIIKKKFGTFKNNLKLECLALDIDYESELNKSLRCKNFINQINKLCLNIDELENKGIILSKEKKNKLFDIDKFNDDIKHNIHTITTLKQDVSTLEKLYNVQIQLKRYIEYFEAHNLPIKSFNEFLKISNENLSIEYVFINFCNVEHCKLLKTKVKYDLALWWKDIIIDEYPKNFINEVDTNLIGYFE